MKRDLEKAINELRGHIEKLKNKDTLSKKDRQTVKEVDALLNDINEN